MLYKELSYEVMSAVFEVHNVLGSGFLERIYENALIAELLLRGIGAEAQVLNYLRGTGLKLGILINFGKERVESKRFAL